MTRVVGVDFSSAPTRKKPIVVASGRFDPTRRLVVLDALEALESLPSFESWLRRDAAFVGGFDFPFGLPREFLESDPSLPRTWLDVIAWLRDHSRSELRDRFYAFTSARPPGRKFAHRAFDHETGASPSMKWVNPPVAWMLREGVPRLVDAGLHVPGLHAGDERRVALEAYPGVVARAITRASYKSDTRSKQTPARRDERIRILDALEGGAPLGIALAAPPELRDALLADGSGDRLDAAICALQAAHATTRPGYGVPDPLDPLEGFIVGLPPRSS